jgi:hypothetical protein
VKRHRARYNNVTSAVTVTPPDTDTDTDTERKKDSEKSTRKSARASRLAPDWQPSIEDINYAIGKGLTEKRINTEAEKFRNYWIAKSGNAASKLDWHATWQNWILNACERGGLPNGRREQTLGDTARELADEIREREHSLGIGRPARDVGRG